MATGGIKVHVYGDYDDKQIRKAQKDLQSLKTQAGATGSGMQAFGKSMAGVGAAMAAAFSVGAVTDFLKESMQAAIEDEKSMVALATAMKNVGVGAQNAQVEAFVESLMLATGTADDELRPALQTLVTATGDVTKSQELLQVAMDASAATGKDLGTISLALSKASMGNVGALTKLGIPLDANIVKTKNFDAAVDVMSKRFAGQAAAAAETYGGKLARIQTAAGEAQETIGYSLLNALDGLTSALGGTDGAVGAITALGDEIASMIDQASKGIAVVSDFAASIAELVTWGDEASASARWMGAAWEAVKFTLESLVGGPAYRVLALLGQVEDATTTATFAVEGLNTAGGDFATSTFGGGDGLEKVRIAAEDAAESLDEMKASFLELTAAINSSQSMDDFKKSLHDLDDTLDKNKRSLKGMGDGAKENRDVLRTAFSDASKIAQQWAEDNGKSAEEAQGYYDGLAKKIVTQFTNDGFKKSDIKAFLGSEGIWTAPMKDALSATERAGLKKAYGTGKAVGWDLGVGMADGVIATSSKVQQMTRQLVLEAEAAARTAAESQSPSELFARIGKDLSLGLAQGVNEGGDEVRKTLQETYADWFTSTRSTLKDGLDEAKALFKDLSAEVSSAIMDGINFGDAAPEFDEAGERVGGSFMESLQAQASKAVDFANQVRTLITMGLSQDALQQVLGAGVTAGTAIANELIAGGVTTVENANWFVQSAQNAADELGIKAASNFYGAGVKSAQETYNGFKAMYGKGSPGRQAMNDLMDNLADSMTRTATITVTTVNRMVNEVITATNINRMVNEAMGLPGRATGGPVAASTAYWVGERGPEVFVPDQAGQIIPNGALPTTRGMGGGGSAGGGGNSYSITVNAAVGDPRAIGQQVIEYIRKFEKANGPVFAAA